jgi:hypothetical protein
MIAFISQSLLSILPFFVVMLIVVVYIAWRIDKADNRYIIFEDDKHYYIVKKNRIKGKSKKVKNREIRHLINDISAN